MIILVRNIALTNPLVKEAQEQKSLPIKDRRLKKAPLVQVLMSLTKPLDCVVQEARVEKFLRKKNGLTYLALIRKLLKTLTAAKVDHPTLWLR